MKQSKRRILCLIMAVLVAAAMLIPTGTAKAAQKDYMKKLGVQFDLQPNQWLPMDAYCFGAGVFQGWNVQIKNLKFSKASKKGYKKCNVTFVFDTRASLSDSQVHAIGNASYQVQSYFNSYFTVLDYNTGMSLEGDNDFDVTVKSGDAKVISENKDTDSHGCWATHSSYYVNVAITYPSDYKGLCIGAGAATKAGVLKPELSDKFFKGKIPFAKSGLYSKADLNTCHFLRLTK